MQEDLIECMDGTEKTLSGRLDTLAKKVMSWSMGGQQIRYMRHVTKFRSATCMAWIKTLRHVSPLWCRSAACNLMG